MILPVKVKRWNAESGEFENVIVQADLPDNLYLQVVDEEGQLAAPHDWTFSADRRAHDTDVPYVPLSRAALAENFARRLEAVISSLRASRDGARPLIRVFTLNSDKAVTRTEAAHRTQYHREKARYELMNALLTSWRLSTFDPERHLVRFSESSEETEDGIIRIRVTADILKPAED